MINHFRTFCWLLAWCLPLIGTAQTAPGWGWVKFIDGNNSTTFGDNNTAGVGRDNAGNIYLAGGYVGTPTVGSTATTSLGGSEAFLAKYDASGNLIWLKALHGTANDAITNLVVLPSGRCVLSGYFGQGPTGGNLSFTEFNSSLVLPGPLQAGLASSGPPSQPLYLSIPLVMVVEPDGTLAWATCPSTTYGFDSKEVAADPQGNVYLAATAKAGLQINGVVYPAIGNSDAILLKYDASGQRQWVRQIGIATKSTGSYTVKADDSSNVYWLMGHTAPFTLDQQTVGYGGGSTLIKLSSTNRVKWAKNNLVQVNNQAAFMQLAGFDASGAIYLSFLGSNSSTITFSGTGSPLTAPGSSPVPVYTSYIMKCDTAASINWVKPLFSMTAPATSGLGGFASPRLLGSANGFTVITSTVLDGQTTFVGSPATYSASEGGQICVLRYNTTTNQTEWVRTAGTLLGALQANSRLGTVPTSAALDPTGNVYVAGTYYGPAQFGAITTGGTSGRYNIYLAKLDQTVLAAKAATPGKAWSVFPNPASGSVRLDGLPTGTTVRVLDALGRPVRRTQAPSLELSGLAPGLYLLQAIGTPETYKTLRLTVE